MKLRGLLIASLTVAVTGLCVLVLWVGNGLREHVANAPQQGIDLGQGADHGQCLHEAIERAQACDEGLFCGAGAGVFVATCITVAKPDGSCADIVVPCKGYACEQVQVQATGACQNLELSSMGPGPLPAG